MDAGAGTTPTASPSPASTTTSAPVSSAAPAPPAPAPAETAAPVAATAAASAATSAPARTEGTSDEDEDWWPSPWAALAVTVGSGMVLIVALQVALALMEGLTLGPGQRIGVPDDLLHRLGYPFAGLGTTALFFLVVAVVILSAPYLVGEELDYGKDRTVGLALLVAIVLAVLIGVGSVLAVRANLHEYQAKGIPMGSFVRFQFASFLIGALGAAALTVIGALVARANRSAELWED